MFLKPKTTKGVMIQQSYEVIVNRIAEATSLPKGEIELKIQQKLNDLQDLISKNGAAQIVANDLGVKLFDTTPHLLKVGNIIPGLQSITITVRVLDNYGVKSFQTSARQGRVLSLMVGDETGTIRTSIWDENIIKQAEVLKTGDIIKIQNAYSKQNTMNPNYRDLHLGNKAVITINPAGEKVENVKVNLKPNVQRKQIMDLAENESAEVFGTIVQVFEPKSYQSCPVCNKKVNLDSEGFACVNHGKVLPKEVKILNLFIDDGSSNIRAIFFRDLAEKLLGTYTDLDALKKQLLGKQLVVRGRATLNKMFNRLEFTANSLEEPEPSKILAEIEEKVSNE
jgi:hypothetical protein